MQLPPLAAVLAFVSLAQTLVVGNKVDDTVSFVDLATGEEVARRQTGRAPTRSLCHRTEELLSW
ncbi:MAG: hypothetical protein AAF225_10900 [Pseudomonadota bacterium]